jgi:hypothetical protein
LENESERAYRAFEVFLRLPSSERTLTAAYQHHVSNPDARPSDTWNRWSSQFAWRERAAAYDDHLASLRREAHEQVIKEEAARHAREIERARGRYNELMTLGYERAAQWLEDTQTSDLRGQDVIKIIGLHLDAVKAFGVKEPRVEDDWTEEDEARMADIIKEIDTLADVDEPEEDREDSEDTEDR